MCGLGLLAALLLISLYGPKPLTGGPIESVIATADNDSVQPPRPLPPSADVKLLGDPITFSFGIPGGVDMPMEKVAPIGSQFGTGGGWNLSQWSDRPGWSFQSSDARRFDWLPPQAGSSWSYPAYPFSNPERYVRTNGGGGFSADPGRRYSPDYGSTNGGGGGDGGGGGGIVNPPPPNVVPEPATFSAIGLLGGMLLMRRRSTRTA